MLELPPEDAGLARGVLYEFEQQIEGVDWKLRGMLELPPEDTGLARGAPCEFEQQIEEAD